MPRSSRSIRRPEIAATARHIAQLSFFFLRRSFFALRCSRDRRSRLAAITDRGYSTNEVDRTNILAPGFMMPGRHRTFVPPSPPRFSGIGPNGKSYPVTAAQLLPILTGFLAPIHFFKLAKNCDDD